MLTVEEAIKQRRSIRHFKSDPVSKEMVLQMLEAARLAPSGSNRQPWRYVVVTDAEEKKKLRALCVDQAFIEEAPVVFVACADPGSYARDSREARSQEFTQAGVIPDLTGRFADAAFRQKFLIENEPDVATVNLAISLMTYISIEHLVLTATALGLGSCWVGAITDKEAIKVNLGIPKNYLVVALVAVGYAQRWPPARPRLSLEQILLRPLPDMR
jgi:nitroreductase